MPPKVRKDCIETLRELECSETFQHAENLTDTFISRHTDFGTMDSFYFGLPKPDKCTYAKLDKYVKRHSEFDTWIELLCKAKESSR